MKKSKGYFRVIFLLIFLFGYICFSKAQEGQEGNKQFHYVIMGQVKNGDKVKISLYIPSRGMENRQTVTIKDGKYKFEGDADGIELAEIYFEKAIVESIGVQDLIQVFIEKDTVEINFNVVQEKSAWYAFKNREIVRGENNLFFVNSMKEFYKAYGDIHFYSDSLKIDSMQRTVYPEAKRKILDAYEKLFYLNEHIYISLYVLSNSIVGDRILFDKRYLTNTEKKKIKYFFDGLDASVHNTKAYKYLKTKIDDITSDYERDKLVPFKDFTLLNVDGGKISIEEVAKNHKITLLDFWWSGCSPCRGFNKKASKVYDKLKENGVEIVSVCNDRGKDKWKISSQKDGIKWTNLYAGFKADITMYYKVSRYPTMIILNDKSEIIHRGYIENPLDLLDYLEK